jgi:hypothetical protein
VLELFARGLSNLEIAGPAGGKPSTVKFMSAAFSPSYRFNPYRSCIGGVAEQSGQEKKEVAVTVMRW